ncbi:MAG: TonB-dependent receptor plug domain-containing protein, partial [Gammaproteobacteria bacterium]|nr:TonB-dependent receptor plug domain-containing protein [Gammaproteobacteria bacterium]
MAYLRFAVSALAGMVVAVSVYAAESRRIEEIVVTAEKRQSTVSDTSISITALNQDFLEDMGIQGPNELVNFVPAMTRNDYDLVIRGVGRNFRSLGGDPGVASYYNGVYSPDFGIAATESALYDLARVEILRGPQGTLYGRNSIGGAVNYITNDPTYHTEGEVRIVSGKYSAREYYGVLSGPIIDDRLAARLVGAVRDRDGYLEGVAGSPDRGSINDQNFALTLLFDPTDRISMKARFNDRRAASNIGAGVLFDEGPASARVKRDTSFPVFGWREVAADFPGAVAFNHPVLGTKYGARRRPGVDPTQFPHHINPAYLNDDVFRYDGGDPDDANPETITNADPAVEFDHQAASFDLTWEINDTTTLKYTYGYQSFIYTFDKDFDYSNSLLSSYGDTVTEDVDSWSHELQLFWEWGDRITGTSGLYMFSEDRLQHYSLRNRLDQGRRVNPSDYGTITIPFIGAVDMLHNPFIGFGTDSPFGFLSPCTTIADIPLGTDIGSAEYCGDAGVPGNFNTSLRNGDTGAAYEHRNDVANDAYAIYTQIDVDLSDKWSVTLGLRYANDERDAFENRGGYFETPVGSWITGYIDYATDCCGGFFVPQMPGRLITKADYLDVDPASPTFGQMTISPLALWNVIKGAATLNGGPGMPNTENPITPVCPLDQIDCGGLPTLSLGGLPLMFGSKGEADGDWD